MKIVVLHSKQINFFITMASVISLVVITVGMMVSARSNRLLPIYCVENNEKQVAVTFDAAWDDSNVNELIKLLDKYDAKATVFAVGDWAEKYPDAVKKFADKGHLIANHSNKHDHIDGITADRFTDDVINCNERLKKLTGNEVKYYRGAYGEYNNMSVKAVQELGMYYIQWDCDSLDWKPDYTVDMIAESALKNVKSGSVMLFHVGGKYTADALDKVLSRLSSEGYRFVTVDDLILKDDYYIDHTGKQCKS